MTARLTSRNFISPDVLYLKFSLSDRLDFLPGQFFTLTLIDPPETDSRGNSRKFGFANSPSRQNFASLITRIGPSAFKRYLSAAPLDTKFDISQPAGNIIIPDDASRPLVFITSDIGLAPYLGILKFISENSLPHQITLISCSPQLLLHDLSKYQAINPRFRLLTPDDIDIMFLKTEFPAPGNLTFFITGMPLFVTHAVRLLRDFGVPSTQMKFEIFTGY
jgi:ferredoxin-NADP reductase